MSQGPERVHAAKESPLRPPCVSHEICDFPAKISELGHISSTGQAVPELSSLTDSYPVPTCDTTWVYVWIDSKVCARAGVLLLGHRFMIHDDV